MATNFDSRAGSWGFSDPIPQWAYFQQVHEWAAKNHFTLEFTFLFIGPEHTPTYEAIPVVNGENLGDAYKGVANTKKAAREAAARLMALSGHC